MLRALTISSLFQSAPLTEARGDAYIDGDWDRGSTLFQSAPLTEARGDLSYNRGKHIASIVSIRSPHRSKGRQIGRPHKREGAIVSIRSPHRSKGRPRRPR